MLISNSSGENKSDEYIFNGGIALSAGVKLHLGTMSDYTNKEYAPHVRPSQLQWMPSTENVPEPLSEEVMSAPYHLCYDLRDRNFEQFL
ncbi:hypothetical protein TNCV_4555681 [Trichonephila clavipes]|nr:hypothetical protein TNCV_4555681 [Trichonephila clavipes]